MLTTHIYSDILQNAPSRSQIFKNFFASAGKGALNPLTKILRTFLPPIAVPDIARRPSVYSLVIVDKSAI